MEYAECNMAVCQNLVPLVNITIAGKWMFIPLKMVSLGIAPYPYTKLERDMHESSFLLELLFCFASCTVIPSKTTTKAHFHLLSLQFLVVALIAFFLDDQGSCKPT
jgi:hypothetical protein